MRLAGPVPTGSGVAKMKKHDPDLSGLLVTLTEVAHELTSADSTDALCRQAVELARSRLGFDRFAIWFISPDEQSFSGSFGTDEKGSVRDERGRSVRLTGATRDLLVREGGGRAYVEDSHPLHDDKGQVIGMGQRAWSPMYGRGGILGLVCTDNLLHGAEISASHLQLLPLYAGTIGHLYSRIRAEEVLAESRQFHVSTLEAIPDPVLVTDLQSRIILHNQALPAVLRTFGVAGPVQGREVSEVFSFLPRQGLERQLSPSGMSQSDTAEYRIADLRGEVALEVRTVPMRQDGRTIGSVVVMRDISDLKQAELQRDIQAMAIAHSGGGIGLLTEEWKWLYANSAMARIVDSPFPEYLYGKHFADLVDPTCSQRLEQARQCVEQGGQWKGNLSLSRQAGEQMPVGVHFAGLTTEHSVPVIIVNLYDRTEEESYQGQIRQLTADAEQALERERARVSGYLHDQLGQSLTALMLRLAWIRKLMVTQEDKVSDEMELACKECGHMADAVRDLARNLRPPILDHRGFLDAVRSHADTWSAHHGIACHVIAQPSELDLGEPHGTAAFRIIQQALENVARHAQATRCHVFLMTFPNHLEITISDNGRGADSDTLGTGNALGILGMRERAAKLGGGLDIRTRAGHGFTLKVSIPLTQSSGG